MIFLQRLKRLQNQLIDLAYDAYLVEDPLNLFYLTGQHLSLGQLLVTPQEAFLIVDGRYFEQCSKSCCLPVVLSVQNFGALKELLVGRAPTVKNLAFNSETTTYKSYQELSAFVNSLNVSLVASENLVKRLRSIKDSKEISILKTVADLGYQGFEFVCSILKEGISEKEAATELEIFWKRKGAQGVSFEPIIAFGANSSMPHYRAGETRLKRGDCVLIDIGVQYHHYCSDMTRVIFFGPADPQIQSIYSIVEKAKNAALALCKPGIRIGDLDHAARNIIEDSGYGSHFPHSLGHGIGLEVHEWPVLRNSEQMKDIPLEAGMAITIEPGIYLPNLGGVRLEDSIIITPTGYENLTQRQNG